MAKEIVFSSGKVDNDTIAIIFCQCGHSSERHGFSALNITDSQMCGFRVVNCIVRVTVSQNIIGFFPEGGNGRVGESLWIAFGTPDIVNELLEENSADHFLQNILLCIFALVASINYDLFHV